MIGALLQNRYRIDAELGHGGMGVVYRAHDTLLDRDVAIKVLSATALGNEGRARLLREAQAAAQLNHPNIVAIHDAGEADNVSFIVMEMIEGESLHSRRPTALDEILSLARQVCAALEHAHAHGIVHRDLKPENVLITPDGTAKLMDFGLARSGASRISTEGAIVGTVFYLAPEQALGQEIDGRADLYALGVMLYELTTGRLPFTGDDPLAVISQHIHAPVGPPRALRPDLPPALETIILKLLAKNPADRFASAREVEAALVATAVELRSPAGGPRNNLPIQLSSFIGRERESDEVKRLLSASRLVTLTGAGGSGKTRLALQVAADVLETFPDGVWLVELAPLSDPALVPQAVVSALDIREQSDRPLIETLSNYLGSKQLLLVLDNCEHLIEACATLAETLLRTCSNLRILATSREAIGITGESAWQVPSLPAPDPQHLPPAEANLAATLMQYEAIRLFVDRAIAARSVPAFALTNQNALAVAQICHRLDGIPLAIELAAVRMKALTVEQIAARLDDRFNLLTVGSRTALPRHQTLRAAIDWSYGLLSEAERVLLSRLSVFAHGWTLEAAEAICTGDGLETYQVLDLLTRLVDKSLVTVEEHRNQARYHLLETLRQYAQEKLADSGESEQVQTRHLAFYLNLAATAEPQLRSAEQVVWLDRLEDGHDNLRAALDWSLGHDESEAGLRLAGSLYRVWYLRGYWSEGREWLERMLSAGGISAPVLKRLRAPHERAATLARAKALQGVGWLADDTPRGIAPYEESLALCREVDDKWGTAFSLRGLGVLAYTQDDYRQGAALLNESLALFRELGDKWGIALALFDSGWLASGQDHDQQAEALWEESLALFRQTGDRWGMAVSLGALRYFAQLQNDYKRAAKLSKESLTLFRELGDKAGIAISLSRLGTLLYRRDDFRQTTALFEEGLALQRELGYRWDTAYSLSMLGLAACYQGDYQRALRRLEESLALWREIGDKSGIAGALDGLGLVAHYQSDDKQATDLWEESLSLFREKGEKSGIASTLHGLGCVALRQSDYPRANDWLEESLALYREVRDKSNIAVALNALGKLAHSQGEAARASELYKEGLTLRKELGAKRGIAESIEGLAGVAGEQEQPDRAARLFGVAEGIREAIGAPLPPVERADYDRSVSAVRAQLGEAAFASVWAEGRAMALEQAIAYGLEETHA